MKHVLTILLAMTAYGCAAKVGAENKTIPTNAAAMCESQCQQAGLHMTALAIMAETIGCVCQRDASDSSSDNAGASAAGMATIMIQQEQAQQQQQQRQQQQQQ